MQSPPSHGSIVPITASTVPAQIQTINSSTTLSPKSPAQSFRSAIQPQTVHASVAPHATTAEDLLKDVMLGLKASDSTSQPRFLQSIWSASSDEQPLKFAAGSPPKNVYQPAQQYQTGIPQPWSSSFTSSTAHPAQHGRFGSMQSPHTLVSSQHASMAPGFHNQYQHQRLSSLTSSPHQRYSVLDQAELQEPLMFSRLSQQQPSVLHSTDMGPLAPLSMSSSNMVNPSLNNVTGAVSASQVPGPYGSPLINGSTPHHASGGLPLSPQGHARQVTFGQSNHSSQSQTSRPPVFAQSFASMHQAWWCLRKLIAWSIHEIFLLTCRRCVHSAAASYISKGDILLSNQGYLESFGKDALSGHPRSGLRCRALSNDLESHLSARAVDLGL